MAELKSYHFTINPVKHRTVYLWYLKVKESEEDAFSAIIRYALENYYESGGKCISIATLHNTKPPEDAKPVKLNIYIGNGTAAELLKKMKANGISKTKVIHAILEGGIEFIPDTEKETIFLPPQKSKYSGVLMAMSDILQTKTGANTKPVIEEALEKEEKTKTSETKFVHPEAKIIQPEIKENFTMLSTTRTADTGGRKKTAAALSGKRG